MGRNVTAGFLGVERRAFFVSFEPASTPRGHVLYLPPFAEEMNRCRNIAAEQARAFADQGYVCTILDFFGTGEAEGHLEEATLDDWLRDIDLAAARVSETLELTVWGCRLGGLLATHYLSLQPARNVNLLLWQPLTSGKAFVTQLFRQRSAARLERGLAKESKDELREQLSAGGILEVGGYSLGGELLNELESMEMTDLTPLGLTRVCWMEHEGDDHRPLPPRTQRAMDHIQEQAQSFELQRFGGPQLWQLHERDRCDPLLAATRGCFS